MGQLSALIIDIEHSRGYDAEERLALQLRLRDAVAFLNELYCDGMALPVVFSGGDEVQGLFFDVTTAFLFFRGLTIFMAPAKIRGGIGIGGWEVSIEGAPSPEQDGTAYHRARMAIEEAKVSRIYRLAIWGERGDPEATVLAGYSIGICSSRRKKQILVAGMVELCRPLTMNYSVQYSQEGEASGREEARSRLLFRLLECNGSYWNAWKVMGTRTRSDFPKQSIADILVGHDEQGMPLWPSDSLRGLSYRLAAVEGFMSRSSIDRLINSGGVVEERNAAALMVYQCQERWH